MTQSSQSLVSGQNMLGKVYFPRLDFSSNLRFSQTGRFCDFSFNCSVCSYLLQNFTHVELGFFANICFAHDVRCHRCRFVVVGNGHPFQRR